MLFEYFWWTGIVKPMLFEHFWWTGTVKPMFFEHFWWTGIVKPMHLYMGSLTNESLTESFKWGP